MSLKPKSSTDPKGPPLAQSYDHQAVLFCEQADEDEFNNPSGLDALLRDEEELNGIVV
jgi:hypothetical protein